MTDETSPADGGGRAWPGRVKRLVRARPKTALAVTAAVALVAAGLGTWAAGTGPFESRDRYCWGAWEEGSGPEFLGDGGGSRTSEETAPTPKRPRGRCTVAIRSEGTSSSTGDYVRKAEVTVTYGPAPRDAAERVEWLDTYLGGSAVPLPDGLPGAVDEDRGLLVLPERCDTPDGRPTAVTIDSESGTDWSDGVSLSDGAELGGARSVAELLVSAANRGMAAAGCAPGRPLRVTSPVLTLAEKDEDYFSRACRIKGMEFGKGTNGLEYQVGAVTRDFQSCSVRLRRDGDRYFDALMVAQPRLAALLDGVPGREPPARGWRGTGVFTDIGGYKVVRAECAGRPVTLMALAPGTRETTRYFVAFTNAVTQRLGCAPVAPGGSGR
ncbi:hypothetical protein ACQUSR_01245 [Streptomyces sp. P1-3]|uniref:hypothetical protein n=1 Tax=Streptomyces sp. P1-3 TaxID=3421658 RepID=UPI003D36BF7C